VAVPELPSDYAGRTAVLIDVNAEVKLDHP
jgi:hypothetical protein